MAEDIESDELTDLSSDTSPESHRRYSSASLFGHGGGGNATEKTSNSNCLHDKTEKSSSTLTAIDRKSLQRDAVRISLTHRRPVKQEMGCKELESLLTAAHSDLDKLVQYTIIVSEENASLKEILKNAVIVGDDGSIGDVLQARAVARYNSLKVWDIRDRKLLMDLPGHADEVFSVDWSLDGEKVASGGRDKVLKLWRR